MSTIESIRDAGAIIREENLTFMAASIAYYVLASVIPLLALLLALLSFVEAVELAVDIARSYLDGTAERVLEAALTATRGRSVAGGVGFFIALWSGMKVFRGLTVAFAEIYDEQVELNLVDQVFRSLIVLGGLLIALAILVATSLALGFLDFRIIFPTLVGNTIAFLMLVLVLFPFYYLLPPRSVTPVHALPGAVFTSLTWIALQLVYFYYVRSAGSYVTYGLLGAILLFITFLYIAAIVLLLGVVVNVVSDKQSRPASNS